MSVAQFIVIFGLVSVTFAATVPLDSAATPTCDITTGVGCMPTPKDCPEGCTCNRTEAVIDEIEIFNYTDFEEQKKPKMEFKFVRAVTNYGSTKSLSDENNLAMEDNLATRLNESVQHVFRGVLVSATLFIACASMCVISVCIYCCHIRRSDRKLKKEVNALAKKLKVDLNKKMDPTKKRNIDPIAESCNVVVEDANVLCV